MPKPATTTSTTAVQAPCVPAVKFPPQCPAVKIPPQCPGERITVGEQLSGDLAGLGPSLMASTDPAGDAGALPGAPTPVPGEVFDLFARMKHLERADGAWPGADTVAVLCEWCTRHGLDPDAPRESYVAAAASGEGRQVDLVHTVDTDAQHAVIDRDQAGEFAAGYGAESEAPVADPDHDLDLDRGQQPRPRLCVRGTGAWR